MKKQRKEETLVHIFPEYGIAVLDGAFTSNSRLKCTREGVKMIKQIIEKLSIQGFKRLDAPPHIDSRDADLIQFLKELGFQKRHEMYAFERKLQMPLPTSETILDPCTKIVNMEQVRIDKLHKAMNDAFVNSVTQRVPLTKEELASRVEDENFLKQASFQASIDEQVISFVLIFARSHETTHLDYQGTVPEYRRKGIGFHLLCRSLTTLRDLGYRKLIAEQILPESKAEICLLKKAGFHFSHSQLNMSIQLSRM